MKTAILTNGSPNMIEAVCEATGLDKILDAVLTVEQVGVFKPHPSVYELPVKAFGLSGPSAVSFQSSNAWDAAAGSAFGYKVAWCNRFGQARERLPGTPDIEIKTLAPLPEIVGV